MSSCYPPDENVVHTKMKYLKKSRVRTRPGEILLGNIKLSISPELITKLIK